MVYEIVSLRFTEGTPAQQQEHLEVLGRWVRTQPGFVDRATYYDAQQARWVDVVTWKDLAAATAAMELGMKEPSLGPSMATMDHQTMTIGHFERRL
jgi:hypothetical protein